MSSFDTRNNSAVMKRAEQLKRWEESDTNREPSVPRSEKGRKIKFSSGCVFLAACLSGDKEEVIKLLESGADINTANVDGLTALHQACIDDNLEMVEFLVEHGADINRQDNEGWTPLHATASCGFVSIARYLVEHGADVAAVSSDGELAVDLAADIAHLSPMLDYMQKVVAEHNIDCEKSRQAEEQMMLNDAKKWLRSDASEADTPHPKTGATALHVAAAKGYTKVLSLLLAGRANVDKQDNDGWTPLHAAAHWGQKEAAEMLVNALADMDVRNYAGQTCIDVAERKMVKFLEELRANNKRIKRRPSSQIRISDTIENHIENTPTKFIRVEVKSDAKEQANEEKPKHAPDSTKPAHVETVEEEAPWRRNSAIRSRNQPESPPKNQVPDKDNKSSESSDVILRRTQSFENDEKKPISPPVNVASPAATPNTTPVRSSPNDQMNKMNSSNSNNIAANNNNNNSGINTNSVNNSNDSIAKNGKSEIQKPKISPGNIFKNFFKSFVPPVRDEESETQRKAHAKRVRETRRSTQGVTLDEIKSAEELVKKKNSTMNNNNNTSVSEGRISPVTKDLTTEDVTATFNLTSLSKSTKNDEDGDDVSTTFVMTQRKSDPNSAISTQTQSSNGAREVNEKKGIENNVKTITNHKEKDEQDEDSSEETEEGNDNDQQTDSRTDSDEDENKTKTIDLTTTKVNESKNITTINNNNKMSEKTDILEDLTEPASPVLVLVNKSDDDKQDVADVKTKGASPASTPAESPVRLREKRSLFDIDNASSMTLAEKLRCEANKYSMVEAATNSTTFSGTTHIINTLSQTQESQPSQQQQTTTISTISATITTPATPTTTPTITTTTANDASSSDNDRESSVFSRKSSTDSTSSSPLHTNNTPTERRPSWRLKFDAGCKFKLEDACSGISFPANNSTIIPSAPAVIAAANLSSSVAQRRINTNSNINSSSNQSSFTRPVSAPVSSSIASTNLGSDPNERISESNSSLLLSGRRTPTTGLVASTTTASTTTSANSGENKENDNRSALASQTAITRRRKPKRRSTGVVHIDMDDLDPERQDSANDNEEKESGTERTSRSRLGSSASTATDDSKSRDKTENGDFIDYKALWEAAKLENEKLKQQLKKKDDEIVSARATVERFTNATTKNTLSEIEKRERRAMERKLSEMEEELKLLQKLKTENDRLRAENRALTRVVSKLTTSAQNQLQNKKN